VESVEVIENEGARPKHRRRTEKLGVRNRIGPSIAGQLVEPINKEPDGAISENNRPLRRLIADRQLEYF
jgi:hypothetical protein